MNAGHLTESLHTIYTQLRSAGAYALSQDILEVKSIIGATKGATPSGQLNLPCYIIGGSKMEKKYCRDCKKTVKVEIYNANTTPPLVVCSDCGQFCYDIDKPK